LVQGETEHTLPVLFPNIIEASWQALRDSYRYKLMSAGA
jgi:hypothetical protein